MLVSIQKYSESDCDMSMANATRRLIDEDIIPKIKILSAEKTRQKYFFTKQVDILLNANEEPLQYAYQKFAISSGGKFIPQAKVLNDILGSIFKIGSSKARVLYARSKMSVANESGNTE